jgi:hypothetical protein
VWVKTNVGMGSLYRSHWHNAANRAMLCLMGDMLNLGGRGDAMMVREWRAKLFVSKRINPLMRAGVAVLLIAMFADRLWLRCQTHARAVNLVWARAWTSL